MGSSICRDVGAAPELVGAYPHNLGLGYQATAGALSEVADKRCLDASWNYSRWGECLQLAGRMMGYMAMGKVRPQWKYHLRQVYLGYAQGFLPLLGSSGSGNATAVA